MSRLLLMEDVCRAGISCGLSTTCNWFSTPWTPRVRRAAFTMASSSSAQDGSAQVNPPAIRADIQRPGMACQCVPDCCGPVPPESNPVRPGRSIGRSSPRERRAPGCGHLPRRCQSNSSMLLTKRFALSITMVRLRVPCWGSRKYINPAPSPILVSSVLSFHLCLLNASMKFCFQRKFGTIALLPSYILKL